MERHHERSDTLKTLSAAVWKRSILGALDGARKKAARDVTRIGERLRGAAAKNTPVVTGKLKGGWEHVTESGGDPAAAPLAEGRKVRNKVIYARPVERRRAMAARAREEILNKKRSGQ